MSRESDFYGPFPILNDKVVFCQGGGCANTATHERLVWSTVDDGSWIETFLCDDHEIPPYPPLAPIDTSL